ncbi:MAG: hypothetical protein GY754_08965 [bacterium]|nr:hypothetical protein [bacterium]
MHTNYFKQKSVNLLYIIFFVTGITVLTTLIFVTTCGTNTEEFRIYPALQVSTPGSVGIVWETAFRTVSKIKVSQFPDMRNAAGYTIPAGTLQKYTVPNLLPNTRYYYTVSAGQISSEINSFYTAPAKGNRVPFRFIGYGDTRTNHPAHSDVCRSMVNQAADFIIHVGDYADGTSKSDITKFFEIEQYLLSTTPLLPVYGNHEFSFVGSTSWDDHLMPARDGTWAYYGYTYGNLFVLVLNTNEDFNTGSPQYSRAQNMLAQASADSDIDHIIVSLHSAVYSSGGHGDLTGGEVLAALFESYGVKAVFQGHDHTYERLAKNSVTYLTVGGGGAPLHNKENTSTATSITFEKTLSYVIVDVNGTSFNCKAIRVSGNQSLTIEEFSL